MLADPPLLDARRRRFTADEVLRMVEAGVLDEAEPLELIDGELYTMSPQGPRHGALTVAIHRRLEEAFGEGFHVRDHTPVAAGPHSLPEPDLAVVRGAARSFLDHHPGPSEVALLVEVSVTSHALDRAKAAVYARAGFAEYWQVDVPGRRVLVFAEPAGAEYRSIRIHPEEGAVDPGTGPIAVADLLP